MHFRRQRDILLTLQERRSRLTLARRILSKDADLTAQAIAAELGGLSAGARRTITHDNGGEFAGHETVTEAIGLRACFCDPHSPWQRGSIENVNGRLRRALPRNPRRLHRCRHRRRDLEPQRDASQVPRLPHAHRGIRSHLGVALEM
jgi:transposase, IS30 family